MNQTEWQPLAVLAAAMLFITAARLIQRLMARAAARRAAAERAAARQAQSPPARPAAEPEAARAAAPVYDLRPQPSLVSPPRLGPPARGARRRVRELLRAPGGVRAAILVGEILGPPQGAPRPRGPRRPVRPDGVHPDCFGSHAMGRSRQ